MICAALLDMQMLPTHLNTRHRNDPPTQALDVRRTLAPPVSRQNSSLYNLGRCTSLVVYRLDAYLLPPLQTDGESLWIFWVLPHQLTLSAVKVRRTAKSVQANDHCSQTRVVRAAHHLGGEGICRQRSQRRVVHFTNLGEFPRGHRVVWRAGCVTNDGHVHHKPDVHEEVKSLRYRVRCRRHLHLDGSPNGIIPPAEAEESPSRPDTRMSWSTAPRP
mmetsp:Transcript_32873/g.82869  ORF Transcript_32873/g.82869 Transcript_32873/m.82869 type:complete len:217 (+) Transcript_32873:106-756(+)